MASHACAAMTSQVPPPTPVESSQVGRMRRNSAISMGLSVPNPLDAKPFTSSFVSPASATARRTACACRS
jgi:hypothetical protein